MGLVVLRNGEVWKNGNWALRELLNLMTDEFLPERDGEALYALVQAEAFTALQLDHEEPALADRLEKVLLRVVHAVVDGRLPVQPSKILQDPRSMEQFRESMRELLKMMMMPIR